MKESFMHNMIDNDFEGSVDDTADEVFMTRTKLHKITKMSIVHNFTP